MKAYVLITASPGKALDISRNLSGRHGVVAADPITGEYDVIAVCEGPDVNAIGQTIVSEIQNVEGVFKTTTCLVFS